jgi:PBP1b-binding outer membrane lipoprotein LpoB
MSKREIALSGIVLALALAGCSKDEPETKPELTQRERDSIYANSQIPGAKAVKKAMTVADSAVARQSRIDTAQNNP